MACRGFAINLGFGQGQCAHLGSFSGRLNSNLPGSTWLLGVEPGAGFDSWQLRPREVGMFVLFPNVRQNPSYRLSFLGEGIHSNKQEGFCKLHNLFFQSNASDGAQSRLRKRGRDGRWSYTCTVRRPECKGQSVEVKTPLSRKDYEYLLNHTDEKRLPIYKTRRCFMYNNQSYQLDIYR